MKKAYLFAGISILLWSTIATVSKLLLEHLGSYEVLCISALFAALALLVINIATGNIRHLRQYRFKDYLTIVLIGLPGTFFYNVFLYAGTDLLQASQAFTINYLWPIMSVVFACIILKETMTPRIAAAIAVSLLGVVTVAGEGLFRFDAQTLKGVAMCVLAAICYGAFTALNKKWTYDKYLSMMIAFFATFVLCLPATLAAGSSLSLSTGQLLGLGWNGVFVLAIATTTWAIALDNGQTAKISNLAYITPFLSLVWTFLILNEVPGIWSIAGLAIIVLGIFIQLKGKE